MSEANRYGSSPFTSSRCWGINRRRRRRQHPLDLASVIVSNRAVTVHTAEQRVRKLRVQSVSGSSGTAEVLVNVAIIEHNEQLAQPPVVVANIRESGSRSSSSTTMPSKQANDVLAVEELVHEIRENLRLKAKPAHQPTRSSRPSPYHIPCRSWSEPAVCGGQGEKRSLHKSCKKQEEEAIEDPYEFLQTLLKNNNLVKEAVRRLQHGLSPKQRYFYESDGEESRSPIVVMCQLES